MAKNYSKIFFILLFLLICPVSSYSSQADYMQNNDLGVNRFLRDKNNNIYVIQKENLYFKSSLPENAWEIKATGIRSISIDPDKNEVLYSITTDNKIQKTYDNGKSWQTIGNDLPIGIPKYRIFINPHNSREVFLCTTSGLYRSNDSGKSWNLTSLKFDISQFIINPKNKAVFYALTRNGLYASNDAGNKWSRIDNNLPKITVKTKGKAPTKEPIKISKISFANYSKPFLLAFAECTSQGNTPSNTACEIFKSVDNGITWTNSLKLPMLASSIFMDNSGIYLGLLGGVLVTKNGSDWDEFGIGSEQEEITGILSHDGGFILTTNLVGFKDQVVINVDEIGNVPNYDFKIRNNKFWIDYDVNGHIKQYNSILSVLENDEEVLQKHIWVKPNGTKELLTYRGVSFSQDSFGQAWNKVADATIMLVDSSGYALSEPLTIMWNEIVKIPKTNYKIKLVSYVADFEYDKKTNTVYSKSAEHINPAIRIEVYNGDDLIKTPWLFIKHQGLFPSLPDKDKDLAFVSYNGISYSAIGIARERDNQGKIVHLNKNREVLNSTNFPDEIDFNDAAVLVKKYYGDNYQIKSDADSGWDEYDLKEFIKPARKKTPFFPYMATGDFNGDGKKPDIAVLIINDAEQRLAVFHMGEHVPVEIRNFPFGAIEFFSKDSFKSYWEEKPLEMTGDGITGMKFESSAAVYYWDGKEYKEYFISD